MIIVTFTDYASARTKLDELNIIANLQGSDQLAAIYVNAVGDTWAINGTDCIDNGGLGRDQITNEIGLLPNFLVNTYQEFFDLGYMPVN